MKNHLLPRLGMKIEATQLISRSVNASSQLQLYSFETKHSLCAEELWMNKLVHEFKLEDNTSKQRLNYMFWPKGLKTYMMGIYGHYVHAPGCPDATLWIQVSTAGWMRSESWRLDWLISWRPPRFWQESLVVLESMKFDRNKNVNDWLWQEVGCFCTLSASKLLTICRWPNSSTALQIWRNGLQGVVCCKPVNCMLHQKNAPWPCNGSWMVLVSFVLTIICIEWYRMQATYKLKSIWSLLVPPRT